MATPDRKPNPHPVSSSIRARAPVLVDRGGGWYARRVPVVASARGPSLCLVASGCVWLRLVASGCVLVAQRRDSPTARFGGLAEGGCATGGFSHPSFQPNHASGHPSGRQPRRAST